MADSRLRVKGRFISKKDSEKLKTKDDSSFPQENMEGYDPIDSNINTQIGIEEIDN